MHSSRPAVPAAQIFTAFLRVSAFTLGGGLAMVPVMATECEKRSWLTESEFYQSFARAQALPGPIGLTVAMTLGIRLSGWKGAAAAAVGILLPPVASVLLIAALIGSVGSFAPLDDFLEGAYLTVPGLALAMVVKMVRTGSWRWTMFAAAALLLAAMIAFKAALVPLFFGGVLVWAALGGLKCRRS